MENLKKELLEVLNKKFINHKGLSKLADILSSTLKKDKEEVMAALVELEKEGEIFEFTKHKYASSASLGLVKGKVSYSGYNYSFVLNEEGDIFVQRKNLLNSLDGDYVLVKILSGEVGNKKREGKVLKILKRSDDVIIGTFTRIKSYGYVRADKKGFEKDIFIDTANINGAKDGDKVVVELVNFKSGNPAGKVTEVIGDPNEVGNDIKCLLKQYKIIDKFPQGVLEDANNIPQEIKKEDYKHRRDLTDWLTFTIDGQDAKDLDDAISLTRDNKGNYVLGVHIADVGEYVRYDSRIDQSAFERGTSIYFLNQVIPMLPKQLSNGICSLNPNVDRLALSVIMKIDASGSVVESEVFESIINSKYRLNYDEVLEVIEGNSETQQRLKDIKDVLLDMYELSQLLDKKRRELGSLDFDLPESKVIVDDQNKPIDIVKRSTTKSTKVIETFMVIANEVIAKKFEDAKIPFVYRVHEKPDSEKMASFFNFISSLGVKFNLDKKDIMPTDLQKILKSVADLPIATVVNMIMLRSLKKAKYMEKCLGHFGLALTYYCHFTSPIRRYPDLCIHRIIKEYLHNNITYITSPKMKDFVVKSSMKSSEMEKNAEDVERAITDYKKCEYMSQFIGEKFEGIINGVNARGFFVELDNTCEGFVSVSTLNDDFYDFDERTLTLSGKKNMYRIGERVVVEVADCNLSERKINFEIVKKLNQKK
ncbi:MAG: ribonuclease R [Clostridia bacterium]|nr:ribonuclease R [Clostridia bacterium]